jgi:LuxR family maltose regulon positive regulatory protein
MATIESLTLLATKLHRPPVTGSVVPRQRLLRQLSLGLFGPLTLVCAPAGFGKTTLVSSWIEAISAADGDAPPLPCAWLSLDEGDGDLIQFLRYLVAALRSVLPGACEQTAEMLAAPRQPPSDILFAGLSNEIERQPGRFVLVMDDFHLVQDNAVHDFLNALVRHWPQPMHLVLISRLNPPLPLAALRARGWLTEVRSGDLRFTPKETADYLDRVLLSPLSEPAAARLAARAEGWIAGLRLATLSLHGAEDPEAVVDTLSGADAGIAAYLLDEVLARQPVAVQTFLLRTSILDAFCSSLCEAVAGGPDCNARACLEWVERTNLFVVPLDGRGEWYRYHHLFLGLLRQRLTAEADADRVAELHGRAADWFAERELVDEALRHAIAAHDLDRAARLIEQGLPRVLNLEDRPALERWLHLLPEEFIQGRPGLLMARAWALVLSWQLSAVARTLRQVEALIEGGRQAPSPESAQALRMVRAQAAVLRGQQEYQHNRPEEALACCREALALLPVSWSYVRGGAMLYMGMSMRAAGQDEAAQQQLLDQYRSLNDKSDSYALRLLLAVCHNAVESGQLHRAAQTAQLMLEKAQSRGLVVMLGWAHFFLGLVHYHRNELDAAVECFRVVVERRFAVNALAARNGMLGLALAHMGRGEAAAARQTVEVLSHYDLAGAGAEVDDTAAARALLDLLEGNLDAALGWAGRFSAPPPDQPLPWLQSPHATRARILLASGASADPRLALRTLDRLHEIARRTHNTRGLIEILALRAPAMDFLDQAGEAQAVLKEAVELAQPGGFIRPFVDSDSRTRDMLVSLAAQGIAQETIGRILAAFPSGAMTVVSREGQAGIRGHESAIVEPLTVREHDVLILLRERLSNKEIAQRLNLSTATVKRHLVNIYGKLGVRKRMEAVLRAEALGILRQR